MQIAEGTKERSMPLATTAELGIEPQPDPVDAIRDLIIAAEMAGWDIGDNRRTLDRARDAFATLWPERLE